MRVEPELNPARRPELNPARRPELNPAQRQIVDLLGAGEGERPSFDADLGPQLRTLLERGLAGVAAGLGPDDDDLVVGKYALSGVHGCEARYLGERDDKFEWTVPKARGSIAHQAIEMGVWWKGEPVPAELVAETLAKRTTETDSLSDWLRTCTDADRAELTGQAVERVTTFFECFPPLKPKWRPTLEGRLRADLFEGRISLRGKYDLSLGSAQGSTAGKVIVDFKTGGFSPVHVDEMRYYALLETLKIGTPPRLVATYYLESGQPHPEAVTVDVLEAAVARTVDGVIRMAELDAQPDTARKRPSRSCRWCSLLDSCTEGRAHLREDGDLDTGDGDDW
jgi:PD-(D/E)XK nuclease superfamily